MRVKIQGHCHKCGGEAKVLIIQQDPFGRFFAFLECKRCAKDWNDVDDVVFIK